MSNETVRDDETPERKLERFEDLARRLFRVPKADVDAKLEEEKRSRERRRSDTPRPT